MSIRDKPVCYVCGKRTAEELDHVFPRALFAAGANFTNLPRRLPACHECNNSLSKDEELFQQLILSWRALDTSEGRSLYETKAGPNLRNRERGLRRRVVEHTKWVPLLDEMGKHVGAWPVMEVPREVVDRVLQKMVKGLYTFETGEVLPSEVEIDVRYAGQNPEEFHRVTLPDIIARSRRSVVGSEDVLVVYRGVAEDNVLATITWFVFYKWHIFCVTTLPPANRPSG